MRAFGPSIFFNPIDARDRKHRHAKHTAMPGVVQLQGFLNIWLCTIEIRFSLYVSLKKTVQENETGC